MKKAIITVLGILTGISLVLLGYMFLMYRYSQEANLGYPVPKKETAEREMHSPYEAPNFEEAAKRREEEAKKEITLSFVGDLNLNGFQALYIS